MFNFNRSRHKTLTSETPINILIQDLESYFSKDNIGLKRIEIATDVEHKDTNSSFHVAVITDYAFTIFVNVEIRHIDQKKSGVDLYLESTGTNFIWFFTFFFFMLWLFTQWLPLLFLSLILFLMSTVATSRRIRIKNHLFQNLLCILKK